MRFEHPELPGRCLHLAYCLNLHAAEDTAGVLRGMREITLPLRDRLAPGGARFGVGMYFPASIAEHLASSAGAADFEQLAQFLQTERLDPFTFNAFPFGNFHADGLKRAVFTPRWSDPARLAYTLHVANIAQRLNAGRTGHVSISTHPGRFGPFEPGEFERAAAQLARWIEHAAAIESNGGPRLRLAMEAEPRAVAGDTRAMGALLTRFAEQLAPEFGDATVAAHLGACLDTCHAAVEFESVQESVQSATCLPLGKLQISSAIVLRDPGAKPQARAALFDLNEPRYLHQTTGQRGAQTLRVDDLPDLRAACAAPDSPWLACDEWRTHFHVPIDLERLADSGLETTRAHALQTLAALLDDPARWGAPDLHLEIETYTWNILPRAARGKLDLVDGLEREYRPVLDLLAAHGWQLTDAAS